MARCTGPGPCPNDAARGGLCWGHLKQAERGAPLTPLRTHGRGFRVVKIAVPAEVAAAMAEDKDGARAALIAWVAARQAPPAPEAPPAPPRTPRPAIVVPPAAKPDKRRVTFLRPHPGHKRGCPYDPAGEVPVCTCGQVKT